MLESNTRTILTEDINVVYNLIFKNALYSVECYKEGCESRDVNTYSFVEDLTDDEGEAEAFLGLMAKGKVLPIHIFDMAKDYFAN
jgi:hypothetical protein